MDITKKRMKYKTVNFRFSENKYCPLVLLIVFIAVSSCTRIAVHTRPMKPVGMIKLPPRQYPRFADDMDYDNLTHAIQKSLFYLNKKPREKQFRFGRDQYCTAHLILSLERFLDFICNAPSPSELNQFIKTNYLVYRSVGSDGRGRVLFTGYYEPFLQGRLRKDKVFKYPVYQKPRDLITIDLSLFSTEYEGKTIIGRYVDKHIVPYYDRRQIEFEDVLTHTADVLAWVKDPVDLFFLHIQGSGKIFTETTKPMNVHYHVSNGRPYRSIGKLLLDEGKIPGEQMSMQSIREYLSSHPEDMERIFSYNPSYVFFKTEEAGPVGYLNVKLTPGRSIALDRRIFPPGALTFIETFTPLIDGEGHIREWTPSSRFMLDQDTGGAIQGPGRADIFWGNGPYAEIAAGHLQHTGTIYFLVLKPDRASSAAFSNAHSHEY